MVRLSRVKHHLALCMKKLFVLLALMRICSTWIGLFLWWFGFRRRVLVGMRILLYNLVFESCFGAILVWMTMQLHVYCNLFQVLGTNILHSKCRTYI